MVESNNPNTIMENFIVDVSKGQNMDIRLMREFRVIINFYRKNAKGKINNPRFDKLFNSLDSRMESFEKQGNLGSPYNPSSSF